MSGRATARFAAVAVLVAAVAVGFLAAAAGGRSGAPAAGRSAADAIIVLQPHPTVDTSHLLFADQWNIQADAGIATWHPPYGTVTYKFSLPQTLPPAGTDVTFSVSVSPNPGQSYNAAMSVAGVAIQSGAANSADGTVKLKGAGSVIVGIQDGPTITYIYKAEQAPTTTAPSGPNAGPSVKIASISGEVAFRRNVGPWVPLDAGAFLGPHDEVFTGVGSKVVLQFSDGSTLEVRELSQLLIDSALVEANRRDIKVMLRLGEISATVKKEKALDTNFEVQVPTSTASVRGTVFSVFYDAVSKASIVSTQRGIVSVDPAKPGLATTSVTAGKEVEVTASSESKLAPIGKAGAHGGDDLVKARRLVVAIVGRSATRCGISTPRSPTAFSLKPTAAGWLVTMKVTGKLHGSSLWQVTGTKVTPMNALAKKISAGCR